MTGTVEGCVRRDLKRLGVDEPETAKQALAVKLGQLLDMVDLAELKAGPSKAASLARELRLTMESIGEPDDDEDEIDKIKADREKRQS